MKKVIIALILGMLIGSETNTFAAVGDIVEATFAEFNYKSNGEDKTIDSHSLVVNGKSYLPTTEIANMLGYDVTYKADSRTIEFNKSTPVPEVNVERLKRKLDEAKQSLSDLNQSITSTTKQLIGFEEGLSQAVENLKNQNMSEEEIKNHLDYKTFDMLVNTHKKYLEDSFKRKAELEKEIADLEAQLSQ